MKYLLTIPFILFLFSACTTEPKPTTTEKAPVAAIETPYVKTTPEWAKDDVMYEVNVRQYTPEGTFKAFQEHLPRLEKMGVDILWFMPIQPIGVKNRKGGLGSYYSVKDYEGINPEFGDMADFKSLVDDAHARGMKVIIDWVANHSAWDNVWVEEGHLDWYTLDSIGGLQPPLGTDWWDVADLNYDNQEMRARMIESMAFWLKEADIDGFRCDVAEQVPDDFWDEARPALDAVKPVFMLAEAEHPEHHDKAFDASYAWEFHFIMNDVAQGKKTAKDIKDYIKKDQGRFPKEAIRLVMTSNHDENTWKGTVKERLGGGVETFAVMAATIQGMPLIYNGQEAGLDHRLKFFEKDEISWDELRLEKFYTTLIDLYHRNPALWNGEHGGKTSIISDTEKSPDVIAYARQNDKDAVIVLLNMSDEEREISYSPLSYIGNYVEVFSGDKMQTLPQSKETLPAWAYRVYERQAAAK